MSARTAARVLAAAGLVAVVSLTGSPVGAHHSVTFYECDAATPSPDVEPGITPTPSGGPADTEAPKETPPPENCMPAEGERIRGTRTIRFFTTTDSAHPLKRVAMYILSQEENVPSANDGAPVLEETYTREQEVETYDTPFSWNSRDLTPYNGKYKIRVEIDTYQPFSNDPHPAVRERLDLKVDNPPLAVPAPRIVTTTTSSVTMNWDAAREPDVLSYTIFRALTKNAMRPPAEAFTQIGTSTGAAFRDVKVVAGSRHWYAVKVTRRSVVSKDKVITSPLSEPSSPALVRRPSAVPSAPSGGGPRRPISFRDLSPRVSSRLSSVPDAPFSYKLDYDPDEAVSGDSAVEGSADEGGSDPRGPVLPVAVGMFLVSSALAVGRMPY